MIPSVRICLAGLLIITAGSLMAQRRGGGGSGNNSVPGGSGNLVLRGTVQLPGKTVPDRIVALERVCANRIMGLAYADSKGRFTFDLGPVYSQSNSAAGGASAESFADCAIRTSLEGYRVKTIPLGPIVKTRKTDIPPIELEPVSKNQSAFLSATDAGVPKNIRKDYDKGIDEAAKLKWQEAISSMQKATGAYPKFATAWLSLGMVQASQNNFPAALQSYAKAIEADGAFAPPYIETAVIEADSGDWKKVIEHTDKAISLDPDAFARAYYLNAMANVRLSQSDPARKSAAEGLRVDQDHLYPDLEYIEGILLVSKGDPQNARKHLESYLALDPAGPNALNAKQQLAALPAGK